MSNELNHMIPGDDEPCKNALQDLQQALAAEEHAPAAETAFEAEAAEGLARVQDEKLPLLIDQLNSGLRKQLKKKKKKGRHGLPDQSFVYITVITVLLLIIIAWIIVRKMHGT